MLDIFSASGFFVHTPCGPRKSGMPESVEMPAPVSTTTRRASSIQRRDFSISSMHDTIANAMKESKLNSLAALRKAARGCRDCPLWENATQTVFGEGDRGAQVMLVGEQPGDMEDLEGEPFVGPAGKLL